MSNYLVQTIKEAVTKDGAEVSPKVVEVVFLEDAINEAGAAVKVRGRKLNVNTKQVDQQILAMEAQIATWKAIQTDIK